MEEKENKIEQLASALICEINRTLVDKDKPYRDVAETIDNILDQLRFIDNRVWRMVIKEEEAIEII